MRYAPYGQVDAEASCVELAQAASSEFDTYSEDIAPAHIS